MKIEMISKVDQMCIIYNPQNTWNIMKINHREVSRNHTVSVSHRLHSLEKKLKLPTPKKKTLYTFENIKLISI